MKWLLMYSQLKYLYIVFLFFSVMISGNAFAKKQSLSNEIQILIDVSGSMKQNDPYNLRIPALKLLINLLPNGTKAGIWLFAENTTELIAMGDVNKKWKNKALARIAKIHSRGLFTNIEKAIQSSTKTWLKSSKKQNRNLILLTDGMVDVSKDFMQSAESRERILVELLPKLQQAGIKVQSIALSSQADIDLLNKLAFNSNGWSETAQSADQLQKIFFNMFKKAMPQDTLPIKGNSFNIDKAINEFSVLIFKSKNAKATQLIAPDKKRILSRKKMKGVAWISDNGYDLITVKKPKPGTWKIIAKMDPDNQVMIVTDLKFQVDDIPTHLAANETINIKAFFTNQQQLITRKDFLSLINITIEQTNPEGIKKQWKMQAVPGKDGLFSQTIGAGFIQGKHSLKITADGKTFQRENIKTIKVAESLITVEMVANQSERSVRIKLIPNKEVINTDVMTIQAIIRQIGQADQTVDIQKTDGQWQFEVMAADEGESKVVSFSVMANTLQGQAISPDIKSILIEDSLFPENKQTEDEMDEEIEDIDDETELKIAVVENDEEIEQEPLIEEETSWGIIFAIVITLNIVLVAIGFFLFKYLKKKDQQTQQQLLDRLGE